MDIFNKELLLIPIHLEVHWSLISVDVRRRTITYFDSQRTLNRRCPKVGEGRGTDGQNVGRKSSGKAFWAEGRAWWLGPPYPEFSWETQAITSSFFPSV